MLGNSYANSIDGPYPAKPGPGPRWLAAGAGQAMPRQ